MSQTAAALVIGNEILTGKVQDTNVAVLARELFDLGVTLKRVVVCPDEVETIASELRELSRRFDWVITSGGVGPTHDDVTLAAVARCFDRPIVRSAALEERIRELVGERLTAGHLRMADVPQGADLLSTDDVPWPTILIGNVFVMPGLPKIFELKLPVLRERMGGGSPYVSRAVYTLCRETEIAELLDRVVARHPNVSIGSYPVLDEEYTVRLTVDGKDAEAVERAVADLVAELPAEKVIDPVG